MQGDIIMKKEYAILTKEINENKKLTLRTLKTFSYKEFEDMYNDLEFEMNRLISKYGLYDCDVHLVKLNNRELVDEVFFSKFTEDVNNCFKLTKYKLNYLIQIMR